MLASLASMIACRWEEAVLVAEEQVVAYNFQSPLVAEEQVVAYNFQSPLNQWGPHGKPVVAA
jgi:hypothetical protein